MFDALCTTGSVACTYPELMPLLIALLLALVAATLIAAWLFIRSEHLAQELLNARLDLGEARMESEERTRDIAQLRRKLAQYED